MGTVLMVIGFIVVFPLLLWLSIIVLALIGGVIATIFSKIFGKSDEDDLPF